MDLHRRARAARICAWPVTVLPSGGTMLTAPCSCNSTNAARSAALARSRDLRALSQATEGSLDRSRRHREVRRLYGFGDELRAVLTADATPWGALTLLRTADRRHFTPADVQIVASVAGDLAEGVRRALLLRGIRRGDDEHAENLDTAGLVQIAADNTITTADSTAQKCLAELRASRPDIRSRRPWRPSQRVPGASRTHQPQPAPRPAHAFAPCPGSGCSSAAGPFPTSDHPPLLSR